MVIVFWLQESDGYEQSLYLTWGQLCKCWLELLQYYVPLKALPFRILGDIMIQKPGFLRQVFNWFSLMI